MAATMPWAHQADWFSSFQKTELLLVEEPMKMTLRTFLLFCLTAGIFFGLFVSNYWQRTSESTPPDILHRITSDYGIFGHGNAVQEIVDEFHDGKRALNVGPSQYCRLILYLADGDIQKFQQLADIPEDPRDMLLKASIETGHWFTEPFDN